MVTPKAMCDQYVLSFYDFPFITVFQTTDLIKTTNVYTDMANGMLVFYGACNTILAVSLQLISFEAETGLSREQC